MVCRARSVLATPLAMCMEPPSRFPQSDREAGGVLQAVATVCSTVPPSGYAEGNERERDGREDTEVAGRRTPPPRHPVSYTHLRAHETDSYLVCRLLLEKKK